MKLMSKFLSVLMVVSLVPVLVLAFLSYRNSRTAIERAAINHLTAVNLMKQTEVGTWIKENTNTLEILGHNPFFKNGFKDLVAFHSTSEMNHYEFHEDMCKSYLCPVIQSGNYTELFIIRVPDGHVLVSTNTLQQGKYYENRPFFIQGMKGTYVQHVYYSMTTQQPSMVISTPLKDKSGEAIAVLAGRVNLKHLSMIMEQTSGLSGSEDSYLVNTFNYFVTEPRFGKGFALKKTIHTLGVSEAINHKSGTGFYTNYRGEKVIGVYAWMAERNLALITEMSQREAFAPVFVLQRTIIVLCLFVAAAVIVISWAVSKSLTKPLDDLVQCTQLIGHGNLDVRFEKTTGDEIGELTEAFGRMTQQLKNTLVSKELLRESELFLRSTLDALSSHIAIIDESGVILAVNEAWRIFAHQNHADMTKVCEGANYFEVCTEIHGDDKLDGLMFLKGMRSVLAGEIESFWLEYPCHSPSEQRWFYCRITPFTKPGPSCVVVAHENITQRKLAEDALKNSELKMRTILDSLGLQVLFLDLDHRIIWANQALCDFVHCEREDLTGKECFDFWDRQEIPCLDCHVKQSISEGRPVVKQKKTSDGKIWNVMGSPVKDHEGRVVSMVEVREDITEKMSIEEQFRQAQKMDAVGQLAGGVAHDFNNMLSVIIGFAELSKNFVALNNPLTDNLNEILAAAKRSTDLTRHLLAFARKQPVAPKILDCNLIIENSRKMLQRLVGEDIEIRFISTESLWPVHMDPSQIDQILTNLAVNARDAIAGTGTITIETQNIVLDEAFCKIHVFAEPGPYVMITFCDDGSGMDEETRLRVFEPFFTTKPMGEGTGLGLSTVFGIIKQNNGMINVYSEPGVGTTFMMYIPRHGGILDEEPESIVEQCPRGSETIMIVEDEKKILKLCKKLLVDLGYRAICFSSPEKALKYFEHINWPIDLMISDVVMPGMNGDELRKHVERIRPGIKTLFMSGYTYNMIAQRGVVPEGLEFIQKPFLLNDFATKVRAVLDKQVTDAD